MRVLYYTFPMAFNEAAKCQTLLKKQQASRSDGWLESNSPIAKHRESRLGKTDWADH
jgi:hypothetical protein